jgi:hypothetical protein
MGFLKDIVGGWRSAWMWFKCRVLRLHSPSRLALGICPCQKGLDFDWHRGFDEYQR